MEDRIGFRAAEAAAGPSRRDILLVATGAAGMLGVIGAVGTAVIMVPRLDRTSPGEFGLVGPTRSTWTYRRSNPASRSSLSGGHGPSWSSAARLRCLRPCRTRSSSRNWPTRSPSSRSSLHTRSIGSVPSSRNWLFWSAFAPTWAASRHSILNQTPRSPSPTGSAATSAPCHGSKYDLAGRVFKDVPALYNFPVPPYRFMNERTIRIGENPPDAKLNSIQIDLADLTRPERSAPQTNRRLLWLEQFEWRVRQVRCAP